MKLFTISFVIASSILTVFCDSIYYTQKNISTFSYVYYICLLALFIINVIATIIMLRKNYILPEDRCLAIVLLFLLPYISSLVMICISRSRRRQNSQVAIIVNPAVNNVSFIAYNILK